MTGATVARLKIVEKSIKANQRKIEEFVAPLPIDSSGGEILAQQIVKSLVYSCLTLASGLISEINSNSENQLSQQWRDIRFQTERLMRQLTLLDPKSDDDELRATLMWMSEKGGRLDLDLLNHIPINNLVASETSNQLLEIARKKIIERAKTQNETTAFQIPKPIMKTYRLFVPQTEFQNLPDVNILQSYPAFTVVSAPEDIISELRKKIPVENLGFQGKINEGEADMATPPPPISELRDEIPREGVEKMRNKIVKFNAPIQETWIRRLEEAGARVLRPAGGFGLIVAVPDDETANNIAAFEEVEKVTPFVPSFRIRPQFLQNLTEQGEGDDVEAGEKIVEARLKAAIEGVKQKSSSIPLPGILVADFFTAEESQKAEETLKGRGIKIVSRPTPTRLILDVGGKENVIDALRDISEQSGLQILEEKTLPRLFNDVAREVIGKGVVASSPDIGNGTNLTGKGEIVAVADSGLDTGEKSTLHPDFQNRVRTIQSYPINASFATLMNNVGEDDGASDKYSGHGTHVAGSVLGDGKQAAAMGLTPVKGMAPEAELVFQAIEQTPEWNTQAILYYIQHTGKMPPSSGLFGIPDDLKKLFAEAYDYGARIHSNSWGGGEAGAYDQQCLDLDEFVWEHKDFLVLVAAGNSGSNRLPNQGIEPMSIDAPGVAKNCLTVGACENNRVDTHNDTYGDWWRDSFPHPPFSSDQMCDSIDDVVAFSSRGPSQTMRRKPDVIAPGTFILSTRSSQMPSNNFAWGVFQPAKAHYLYMGGTSMATPLVAGAAALVRQYIRAHTPIANPSAALLKATIIHSAQYRTYRYRHASSAQWADNEQGWGRVNLINVLAPDAPVKVLFFDETGGLASGVEKIYQVDIADDSVSLRATLVYTDFPGEQLINNLNLLLFAPSGEYFFGNDFENSKQPDTSNNVEGVVIESPEKGVWTLKIVASNIAVGPQDYALVISAGEAKSV